jgi:Xaa-Pro aminopeptidase
LFVRPRDPEREIWDGRRAGVEGAKSEFGAEEAFPIEEFESKLTDFLDGADVLYYRLGVDQDLDNTIIKEIARMRGSESQADSSAADDHRSGDDRSRDARAEESRRDRDHADGGRHRCRSSLRSDESVRPACRSMKLKR